MISFLKGASQILEMGVGSINVDSHNVSTNTRLRICRLHRIEDGISGYYEGCNSELAVRTPFMSVNALRTSTG